MKAMKAMKAMKVMKTSMKKSPAKGTKGTPLSKGNLSKLGTMSLKDKVKKIADENEDEVAAAMVLKEEMTPSEKVRAWGRYDGHLKKCGNEAEQEEFKNSSKKEKGLKVALYLMRSEAPKFCSVSKQAAVEQELLKKEKWLSEKEAIAKWGEEELWKHCESGRVIYKETSTKNVWEYQDTQAYTRRALARQSQNWMVAQEFQQHPEEEGDWQEQLGKDLISLLQDTPGKGKTKGKGKGNTPEKGKGKGGRRGRGDTPLPLEDLPAEEQMQEALSKLKKTRDMLASTSINYEEALSKVKKCNYLTKSGLKQKECVLKSLGTTLASVKQHLAKGENNKLAKVKDVILEAAELLKEAKEESKELVQISMKTHSKASKK